MQSQPAPGNGECCFHHSALFYSGENAFIQGTLPFLKEAVAAEEPTLVAVVGARVELLRDALGSEGHNVHFADMRLLGSNPARIIPAWRRFLDEHAPDERPVRGIGEPIWAGRNEAELTECQRHESLLNVAFDGGQAWQLMCPYDLDALDDDVIEAARHSHPFLSQEGASRTSDTYLPQQEATSPFRGELPPPCAQPQEQAFTRVGLARLRRFVSQHAASLDSDRTADLVLAVNELATNSVRYGGGTGTLRIWTDADTLMCEVNDSGHITQPLVGRTPPVPTQPSGRGLWVVNQLCDLVQIRSKPTGSVVRLHMRLV